MKTGFNHDLVWGVDSIANLACCNIAMKDKDKVTKNDLLSRKSPSG